MKVLIAILALVVVSCSKPDMVIPNCWVVTSIEVERTPNNELKTVVRAVQGQLSSILIIDPELVKIGEEHCL